MNDKTRHLTDENARCESSQQGNADGDLTVACIIAVNEDGRPELRFDDNTTAIALATVKIESHHMGRRAVIMFVDKDCTQPVVIGMLKSRLDDLLDASTDQSLNNNMDYYLADEKPKSVHVDGRKVIIDGQDEIILRCGESSITLNKDGKISIRGKYLLSRSTGVNRIMGGAVNIN